MECHINPNATVSQEVEQAVSLAQLRQARVDEERMDAEWWEEMQWE